MPRISLRILTWSQDRKRYELFAQGQLELTFLPGETDAWLTWLATATSFTFQGAAGHLNVYQEARGEAGSYWYASHTTGKRTYKRYLGQPARVTFARLEEVASLLAQRGSAQDSTSPDALPGMPLLSTSLVPPLLRSDLVVRERLLTRLDAARSHRLTLLAASAGWGKTTLLSLWATRSRFPVAWLSLDALANDPTRFWVAVISALRYSGAASPLVGERALMLLRSPQPASLDTTLGLLVQDLSEQSTPIFLLLDDYQVIDEQDIHDSLLFLLEHLPAHLHLVLASRTDPPLLLARWRAHNALLELRDADLRFREEEVSQFLAQTMALALDPTEVALLGQRTEGWVAGLHLAALALSHARDHASFIRGFAGSHRYLMDYVQEDILAHVEQPLQAFLLHCAVLPRLSAALCQVVTAQADIQGCQQMLERLERANLFLVPLDEERRWYRMHDLFREALLARLHATQPEMVRVLHIRAASFYEQQGEWSEAIAHRFAAADYASAMRLMEQTAEHFWLHGEVKALYRWIMALPDEVIRIHAAFALKAAWYLLNSYFHTTKARLNPVRAQVERLLHSLEGAILSAEGEPHVHLLRQRFFQVRLMSEIAEAEANGDLEQVALLIQQEGSQVSQDDDLFWQMIPLGNAFVYHYTIRQDVESLLPRLLEMKPRVSQSGDRFAMIKLRQWVALASIRAGQLRQAHRESLEVLALLEHRQGHAHLAGYISLCLAHVLLEWNQLDEARTLLRQSIADATDWQHVDQLGWGYTLLAELEIAAGNLQTANDVLQEEAFRLPEQKIHQVWGASTQVRLWLAQGNLAAANAWAAQAVFRPADWTPQQPREILALLRIFLAQQQYSQALEIVEAFREQLDQPGNVEITIQFLSISATTLHLAGKQEGARADVLRLLHLTRREGHLRTYLDMGEPMRELLQSLLAEAQGQGHDVPRSSISTLLAAIEQEKQKRTRREASANMQGQADQMSGPLRQPDFVAEKPGPLEALTSQERRVLRLLAAGHSNQEIAQTLVVSRNTVKTHIQNLYNKLQVKNRVQAITLARSLQLL